MYIAPLLFKLYAEYTMWNAELDKTQHGIKTAGRNNNNLRFSEDTTLKAKNENELKNLLRFKNLA